MVMSVIAQNQSIAKRNKNLNPLPAKLFGTDGIRGKVGELLTAELAFQVGIAAGQVWHSAYGNQGIIIIGQDSRSSSEMLTMAISSGLTAMGLDVWNLGLCPTPCVAYLTKKTEAIGGIMISASHNPPKDNGIKFFGANGAKLEQNLAEQIEQKIRHNYNQKNLLYTHQQGKTYLQNQLIQEYVNFLLSLLPLNLDFRDLRIVLDLAWGAAVEIAPLVFRALGAEVITINHLADGDRINVNCGSTHLQALQQAVQKNQADLGFAFDGDADRVMAVTAQGEKVCGDYILYLWGKHLKEQNLLPNNLLIGTVMANLGFELAWQKIDGKLIRTAVGDQYVQAEMWETGAMLGGEQSGHILCHHHHFSGDGIQTAIQLTLLVKQQGGCLTSLVQNSFTPYPQLLKNVLVENREKRLNWQQSEPIQQAIIMAEQAMGNQGRVLVRASGTEPVIRVMVEAQNQDLVNHWTDNLVTVIKQNLAV
jgi:phosphoglucosamine mutase